jgi:EmrB/QacA subfamily drug resistance transporter
MNSVARQYLIFAIVGSGLLMASIDSTIVAVALPAMLRELHTGLALTSWSLTSYALTQTIVLPLAGKLTDRWGRKRLFLCAVVLFTLSSIGAGLSPNIYVLIAFRILQAMGGGMFFPCAAGVVGDVFLEKRQTPIGLFATIFQLGGIIGPNIGGLITDAVSWRWIFFVNLPIGVAILLLGLRFVPKDKARAADFSQQMDTAGAGMFAGGMFALLFGLTYLASHPGDFASPTPWLFLTLGLLLLVLFIRHESRCAQPIIDMQLIRWRPFFAANAQIFMGSASFQGFFNFMPYYATIAYGMSATQSGALLTPRSIAAVVVSILVSVFVVRRGYRLPWLVGGWLFGGSMLVASLGLHDLSFLGLAPSNFLLLSLILLISGVGMGMGAPSSQNASLDLLPDKISAAAGIRAMFGNSGGVLGTTLVALALSQFDDKVTGMRYIFLGLGCTNLLSQVWIFLIPDTARQRWREGKIKAAEIGMTLGELGG